MGLLYTKYAIASVAASVLAWRLWCAVLVRWPWARTRDAVPILIVASAFVSTLSCVFAFAALDAGLFNELEHESVGVILVIALFGMAGVPFLILAIVRPSSLGSIVDSQS